MTSAVPSQLLPTKTTLRVPPPFAIACDAGSNNAAASAATARAIALRDLSIDLALLSARLPKRLETPGTIGRPACFCAGSTRRRQRSHTAFIRGKLRSSAVVADIEGVQRSAPARHSSLRRRRGRLTTLLEALSADSR